MIRALQHIQATHGDLQVLESRPVWYDTYSLFPDAIELDARVKDVASFHTTEVGHVYDEAKSVRAEAKDRREFKAFVL